MSWIQRFIAGFQRLTARSLSSAVEVRRCTTTIENDSSFIRKAKDIGAVTTVISHIVVVVVLVIGLMQLNQAKRFDEKRVALDAVNRTKENDFLRMFARLKTISRYANPDGIEDEVLNVVYGPGDRNKMVMLLTDDVNFVLNTYDHIAMLLLNKLGDQDIIRQGVYPEVRELSKILDSVESLVHVGIARRNINKMHALFRDRDGAVEKQNRYQIREETSRYLLGGR